MKISFSRTTNKNRGIDNFLKELSIGLSDLGVKIVGSEDPCDIHLSVVRGFKKRCKNILRLDGVYYDKERLSRNKEIVQSIQKSDGVIFQSEWSKKFVTNMLMVNPKKTSVIYNGVCQSKYKTGVINKMGFDKVFISVAHWRTNKRPEAIADAFVKLQEKHSNMNLGMWFVGNTDPQMKRNHPNIIYFGNVDHKKLVNLYNSSDYMVHICHLDACSNSVVEGLSSGLPVVCNNIGGTPEIVRDSGIVVDLDVDFNFSPISSMSKVGSGMVDTKLLCSGMEKVMNKEWTIDRNDLDISETSRKYIDFFNLVTK